MAGEEYVWMAYVVPVSLVIRNQVHFYKTLGRVREHSNSIILWTEITNLKVLSSRVIIIPFNGTQVTNAAHQGTQCKGRRIPCPYDSCNFGYCYNGCAEERCTKIMCHNEGRYINVIFN